MHTKCCDSSDGMRNVRAKIFRLHFASRTHNPNKGQADVTFRTLLVTLRGTTRPRDDEKCFETAIWVQLYNGTKVQISWPFKHGRSSAPLSRNL